MNIPIPYRLKDKWGFCNENREIIITCIYEYAKPFQEGLAPIQLNGLWGAISPSGELVIPCIHKKEGSVYPLQFSEGLAIIYNKKGKMGFINKKGKIVIEPKYSCCGWFFEGLAIIESRGKLGFINKKGEVVIPCKYDVAMPFENGVALVGNNKSKGFISKTGIEFWDN